MSTQFKILIGILFTFLTIIVLVILGLNEDSRMQRYQTSFAGRSIQAGAEYFETYCSTCHGQHGEGIGGKGPPLNRTDLLDLKNAPYLKQIAFGGTTHDFIKDTIAAGRPQKSAYYADQGFLNPMPTWSQDYGGPLRPDQVDALTNFILNWSPGEFPPLVPIYTPTPAPTSTPLPPGQKLKPPFPLPPSQDIIDAGKVVFTQKCQACHGENRDGKGPGAVGLPKPPRNFTDCAAMGQFTLAMHLDAVTNGRVQNGMPAWGKTLTQDQIWDVIMYEREACKIWDP